MIHIIILWPNHIYGSMFWHMYITFLSFSRVTKLRGRDSTAVVKKGSFLIYFWSRELNFNGGSEVENAKKKGKEKGKQINK